MDDKRLLSLLLLLFASVAGAADLEYITPAKQNELKVAFETAKPARPHGSWSCDMYGVRTRLQIQRGLKLYEFDLAATEAARNSGAQPVSEYSKAATGWIGKTTRLEDELRMSADGKMLARLTLNEGTRSVLAYSVCQAL